MRITMILTVLTGVLLFWQLFASKGTLNHIIRWALIMLFSIAVVVINTFTAPISPKLFENPAFLLHIGFGALYFIGLILLPFLGFKVSSRPSLLSFKKLVALGTIASWILSMIAAAGIQYFM